MAVDPIGQGAQMTGQQTPQAPVPNFPGTQLPQQYGGRGFSGPQAGLNTPGVERLAQAGTGQQQVNTGLPKEVEAAYILAQQGLVGAQPPLTGAGGILERGQELTDVMRGSVPGIQDFMQQQAGLFRGLQGQQLGQVGAGQAGVQNALAQMQGLQGAPGIGQSQRAGGIAEQALGQSAIGQLNPEMQALVDRERQLAIQRAQVGTGQQTQQALDQLQAAMAGRGLGASSIASRGSADVLNQAANRQEEARLAAEQQGLQRELGLRGLGLQERGQTLQGALGLSGAALQPAQFQAGLAGQQGQLGLGLGQQGLQGLDMATQGMQQFGAPAQSQAQIAALSQALGLERGLRQEQIAPELQALQIALGAPVQPSGPGLGEVLGGLAGTAIGGAGSALSGTNFGAQ